MKTNFKPPKAKPTIAVKQKLRVSHASLVDRMVWAAENRGEISKIAKSEGVRKSPQFVSMILKGERKSRDGLIEKMLRDKGAPIGK